MISMNHKMLVSACLLLVLGGTSLCHADRPACYKLLPKKTLAYVRIADLKELGKKFNETSMGRMAQEEQLKSLTSQLFEEAEEAFTPVADDLGLSLSELLAIPTGEIAFAVTAPPNGLPAVVLMVDIDGQEANAVRLLERMEEELDKQGELEPSKEVIGKTKVSIYKQDRDERFTGLVHFRRDGMLVMTSNLEVAKQIVAAWDGDVEQQVLEENEDFADVMRHSKGPREAVPQIRWFIDPISFAKVAMRGNAGAQMGLAMLPAVGLDGLLAVGGSMTFASDEYDSFIQMHVITAEPRTGALAAIAMKSGKTEPEDWVPNDVASYTTMNWDFDKTRKEVGTLYDSFRGDDKFEEEILRRASEALDVDVTEKIIKEMGGRVTLASWYPKPTRVNGVAYLGGIHLKEDNEFEETMKHAIEYAAKGDVDEKSYAGFTIYSRPQDEDGQEDSDDITKPLPAIPCFALVDDCLLISNRPEYIERAIVSRSASAKSLKNELDFKLVASKVRRQPGGRNPGMFSFSRPEEGMRMVYDLATSEQTRSGLANAAEGNELLGRLNRVLEDNPLPPFAKLREYLAPVGSIMKADDTGFHYIGFGLRRGKK